jgi:protein subunit release factor B
MTKQSENERKPFLRITKDDLTIQTFAAGGPGGQHQNKTATGVRIIHEPSGARGECRTSRSQLDNKRTAFRLMCADPKLMLWVKFQMAMKDGILAEAEAYAEREINNPAHISVEVQRDGKWVREDELGE